MIPIESCPDPSDYVITEHARQQMARRGVLDSWVNQVLRAPDQRYAVRRGRCVYQSRVRLEDDATEHLLRVFVDVDRSPLAVVTVYLTSKVSKYWR